MDYKKHRKEFELNYFMNLNFKFKYFENAIFRNQNQVIFQCIKSEELFI